MHYLGWSQVQIWLLMTFMDCEHLFRSVICHVLFKQQQHFNNITVTKTEKPRNGSKSQMFSNEILINIFDSYFIVLKITIDFIIKHKTCLGSYSGHHIKIRLVELRCYGIDFPQLKDMANFVLQLI